MIWYGTFGHGVAAIHTLNTDTFHDGSELREIEVVKGQGSRQ